MKVYKGTSPDPAAQDETKISVPVAGKLEPRMAAIRLDFNRRYRDQDVLRQELFDEQSGLCTVCKGPMQSADSVVTQIGDIRATLPKV